MSSSLSALAHIAEGGVDGTGETPGGGRRKVSYKTGARSAHFLQRQLDPEVVAAVAVVKGGHRPGHLSPVRVVGRMVVAAVIRQLLHSEGRRAPLGHAVIGVASLPIALDNAFWPDLDVVGVLAGITPGATLA